MNGPLVIPYHSQRNQSHLAMSRMYKKQAKTVIIPDTEEDRKLNYHSLFDKFINDLSTKPINVALEENMKVMFRADKALLWIDVADSDKLYSPTAQISCDVGDSIPGIVIHSNSMFQIRKDSDNTLGLQIDQRISQPNSPQMFIPISGKSQVYGVLQIIRKPTAFGFVKQDSDAADFLIDKFSIYADQIFKSLDMSMIALELFTPTQELDPSQFIADYFECEYAEIWNFDLLRNAASIYDIDSHDLINVNVDNVGIAQYCAQKHRIIDIVNPKDHPSFSHDVDGECTKHSLFVPLGNNRVEWVVALRGGNFSHFDSIRLKSLLSFVIGSIEGFRVESERSSASTKFPELTKIAQKLSKSIHSIDIIRYLESDIKIIMDCNKCVLYTLDDKYLVYKTSGCMRKMDKDRGVAGFILSKQQPIVLQNPAKAAFFDPEFDEEALISSKPLVASPMFGPNCEPIGVIVIQDKIFDDNDLLMLRVIALFAGLALSASRNFENAERYIRKTRDFVSSPTLPNLLALFGSARIAFDFICSLHTKERTLIESVSERLSPDEIPKEEKIMDIEGSVEKKHFTSIAEIMGQAAPKPSTILNKKGFICPIEDTEKIPQGVFEATFYGEPESTKVAILENLGSESSHLFANLDHSIFELHTENITPAQAADENFDIRVYKGSVHNLIKTCILSNDAIRALRVPAPGLEELIDAALQGSHKDHLAIADVIQGFTFIAQKTKLGQTVHKTFVLAAYLALLFIADNPLNMLKLVAKSSLLNVTGETSKERSVFLKNTVKISTIIRDLNVDADCTIVSNPEFDATESRDDALALTALLSLLGSIIGMIRSGAQHDDIRSIWVMNRFVGKKISGPILKTLKSVRTGLPLFADFTTKAAHRVKRVLQ